MTTVRCAICRLERVLGGDDPSPIEWLRRHYAKVHPGRALPWESEVRT